MQLNEKTMESNLDSEQIDDELAGSNKGLLDDQPLDTEKPDEDTIQKQTQNSTDNGT